MQLEAGGMLPTVYDVCQSVHKLTNVRRNDVVLWLFSFPSLRPLFCVVRTSSQKLFVLATPKVRDRLNSLVIRCRWAPRALFRS